MNDDAKVDGILFMGFSSEEEAVLRPMEDEIIQKLLEKAIADRPTWISNLESGERVVQLALPGKPEARVLIELPPEEVINISQNDLIARLEQALL